VGKRARQQQGIKKTRKGKRRGRKRRKEKREFFPPKTTLETQSGPWRSCSLFLPECRA